MICVYDKKTKKGEFENIGLGVLDESIATEITEELNGEYSLYLEYPANSKKANYLVEFNIIKANGQLFRIYKVEREVEKIGKIKVWARHIFYDLAFYFIEAATLVNANMKEAIEGTIPPEAQAVFKFTAPEENIYPFSIRNVNALEDFFKILQYYGGEVKRDNFNIEILKQLGTNSGILIKYGKNIKGMRAIIDTNNFATKVYPIGKDNLILPERYIEAEGDVSKILPYPIVKKVEFDAGDVDELRNLGKEYIKKASNPFVNIEVDFLELSKIKEYENFKSLTEVNLGDEVEVKHELLGITAKLRVIKKRIDLLNPLNTKIELGDPLNTIIEKLDFESMIEKIESKISDSQNQLILKRNAETINISTTKYQAMIIGFSVSADTNLTANIVISGKASFDLTLSIFFSLDNKYYDLKPVQKIASGDNIINVTLPMPQVTAGQHSFIIEMQTSNGTFTIEKNNLQVTIEGRNLEGGLSPKLPRAEVLQAFLYELFLNKIEQQKQDIVLTSVQKLINDIKPNIVQTNSYADYLAKSLECLIDLNISKASVGISETFSRYKMSDYDFDSWINFDLDFEKQTDGTYISYERATIKELEYINQGIFESTLGNGVIYGVNLANREEYNSLVSLNATIKEV
ncbi:phage tail spike protein [Caloramator proteoclasticus]|uniref:Phage minor structural protein, N-terminal region n=1 Tax=Caloramator proteoclasticus DSM 10124 TaxID=1121262 RepID=A0A1M5AHL7_9CLOT|nr:phage tail spike protein [Caloramator proteoclasticus]SHF29604.1 phage minor structural protein, N-terminal region [Caloramator proteoclasticus DSM 10124]